VERRGLMNRKIVIGGVLGVLILLIVGVAVAFGGDRSLSVRVETVERRDLVASVSGNGKIQPRRKVDISADVSGRVVELAVEEGQMVAEGDLLLRIDPTTFAAAVRRQEAAVAQARAQASQSEANLLQSRQTLQRAERLSADGGLISAADLEDAHTRVAVQEAQLQGAVYAIQSAEAALSEARDQLRKTTIVAPMSGRVTRLNIEEGETAIVGTMNNPGSLLLTVADLSEMEARVTVDETDLPRIGFGDVATVRIDAFPNQAFTGRVARISNSAVQRQGGPGGQADGSSVDFEVVIALDDPPVDLRPDLSTTAQIVTGERSGVLAIPILSLTVRQADGQRTDSERVGAADGVEGVFVVESGVARFVPVDVGITGDRYFEVVSGLSGGETVVSGTFQAIRELEDGRSLQLPGEERGMFGRRGS
jgi:HlyD family secretion protein